MSVAVSVLVPVYNVEKTLERCIESILNQTFTDYEIILSDDGSTDDSGAICDQYAAKYSNIRVIHKDNEGLGPTRNCGIKAAVGEYIYHCDSDDWLKEDLLEKTYDALTRSGADFLVFGYDIFTEKDGDISPYDSVTLPECTLSGKADVRSFFAEQYYNSFSVLSACNRLYRRSFLLKNDLFFPPLRRCQDMAYSFNLFEAAERVTILKEAYYCYIIEPGVFKGRSFEEMLAIYKMIYELSASTFSAWGVLTQEIQKKLAGRSCEHIANYSSYAMIVKYPKQWRANCDILFKDETVKSLVHDYSGASRFMKLFCFMMKRHWGGGLKLLFILQQAATKRAN